MGRRVSGDEGRHLIRHPPRGRSAVATFSSRRRLWAGDGGKTPFPQGKALGAMEAEGEDGAAFGAVGGGKIAAHMFGSFQRQGKTQAVLSVSTFIK